MPRSSLPYLFLIHDHNLLRTMYNLCGWNTVVTLFPALYSFCTVGKRSQTCVKRASIRARTTFHLHSTHLWQIVSKVPTAYFEIHTTLQICAYPKGNWYRPVRKKVDQKIVLRGPPARGQPACIMRPMAIFANHVSTKINTLTAICTREAIEPTCKNRCGPSS
jgi:hypothetical protein